MYTKEKNKFLPLVLSKEIVKAGIICNTRFMFIVNKEGYRIAKTCPVCRVNELTNLPEGYYPALRIREFRKLIRQLKMQCEEKEEEENPVSKVMNMILPFIPAFTELVNQFKEAKVNDESAKEKDLFRENLKKEINEVFDFERAFNEILSKRYKSEEQLKAEAAAKAQPEAEIKKEPKEEPRQEPEEKLSKTKSRIKAKLQSLRDFLNRNFRGK